MEKPIVAYRFNTKAGLFSIRLDRHGRWHAMFDDEDLGAYATAQHACDDLVGGHTDWPSCGDPSLLKLPDEVGDWTAVRAR